MVHAGSHRLLLVRHLVIAALSVGMTLAGWGQSVAGEDGVKAQVRSANRLARTAHYLNGRHMRGGGSAAMALDRARQQHQAMLARADNSSPNSSILSAAWMAVGPAAVASVGFGNVTGRVTAVAIDPADTTGNTVYVGTTGGGVWKSTNAAGLAAAVTFQPLTDTLTVFNGSAVAETPSLSIGAVTVANGVVLAGTGDPNDATDSYYGAGILRSADGGSTWTLAQASNDGVAGNHPFFGMSVAGMAFSTLNPALVVAAFSQAAEAVLVNAGDATFSEMGLYWSSDAGTTWHLATLMDGSQTVQTPLTAGNNGGGNAATAVVWNPVRQLFYAAVRYHGYYSSPDGVTWTRLARQPGVGLTTAACPPNAGTSGNPACPIFRGALAVQAGSGDTFALTVDAANRDEGLSQDVCGLTGAACGNAVGFMTALKGAPLEVGNGSAAIAQGDYNLTMAAAAAGADTILYVGTTDLYRCSLAGGCNFRNTTNAENGCANPALVAPSQHAIATMTTAGGPLLFLGNDGGLWRSTDGVNELAAPCSLDDATHFQNLNAGIGSLAEVVSFAQAPVDAVTLLAGLGALGTAGTSTVTNSWVQMAPGEGGTVAIDQANPLNWYVSTGAGVSIGRCSKGSGCTAADFGTTAIGAVQVAGDVSAIHAPWLLDPALASDLIAGTCRVWRGAATGGGLWSGVNAISRPFAGGTGCAGNAPVVRSLAAGGAVSGNGNAQNAGSEVVYVGMAGALDGGQGLGGHLFVTTAGNLANNATVWTDAAKAPVLNDVADHGVFNAGGFDISSVAVDAHDTTGATVYATVMGFQGNGTNAPHVYQSVDAGAHWNNITSNLPNAPANSVVVDPNDANTVYVATDTGVYVTTQVTTCISANCWSVYGTALPYSPVVQLRVAAAMPTGDGRKGELRAATYGRGIWQIPLLTAILPAAPAITLSPTTVTYSSQQVGTASASVTISVTNSGTAPLSVTRVATTGDYSEADNCVGAAIAPGATCAVQVTFLPTATGVRSGLLTVFGNVSGGQATATLTGTGTPGAAIVLTPAVLGFGSTNVGATSGPQSITIANTGGTAASLQMPVVTGDFTLRGNTCGNILGAGTSCTLSIVFAPTASGTRQGTVTVVDSAGTQVASLTGIGTNPATDLLSPLALSFAAQQLNTASAGQQVTLTNAGDVALTLIGAQVASGDFAVLNGCGVSLSAHSSCAMTVTYSPKSVGAQAGSLIVSDQFRSQTVALSGIGLAGPGVSLSPSSGLSFGAVGVGLSAAGQTVTLTNNGGVSLAIASVVATGDYGVVAGSNTCVGSLVPSGACTVQIAFSPTVAGPRTGTVTFSDNAPNSPQSLQLTGTGVDFTLASNGPSTITVPNGKSATYALLLDSAAGLPGTVTFTCAGVPAHALCTVNPGTAGLGGATNISVTVATGLLTAEMEPLPMPWSERVVWMALLVPFGLVMKRRRAGWVVVVLLGGLITMAGCGAGRTVPTNTVPGPTIGVTPSGTYTLVVAGSSAGLVRSVNLTLIVQ